ncbi:MAG: hypothetical protein L6Q94_23840, partial [Calditrichia bacterium]|nr:hypothetical protein [Calditrichia bacterium]
MKKFTVASTLLLFLLQACGAIPASAPAQPNVETVVAATLNAVTQQAASAPTEPSGTPVTFQNVSFIIPQGLSSGANSEIVPLAD